MYAPMNGNHISRCFNYRIFSAIELPLDARVATLSLSMCRSSSVYQRKGYRPLSSLSIGILGIGDIGHRSKLEHTI